MASEDSTCAKCCSWTISILLWGSIIFAIIMGTRDTSGTAVFAFVLLAITATIYLVAAFCSSTCEYLRNLTSGASIYGYMQTMFYTPAHLAMHVQCYHNETRYIVEKNAEGKTSTRTDTTRVDTHSSTENFYYISWRDVSGQFLLDTSGAQLNEKLAFVKLNLTVHMEFAGDGTKDDYEKQREWFKSRNRLDVYQDYNERTELAGFKDYTLVRVTDYNPSFFGMGWYALFTVLTLVEFYKLYVNMFCISQRFAVTKVVSSRRDINAPEYIAQYVPMVPCIVYLGQTRIYDAVPVMPAMVPPPPVGSVQVPMVPGMMAPPDAGTEPSMPLIQ